MFFGVVLLVAGVVLAAVGHTNSRLQVRAIGAGLAAFGAVTLVLPILFE